MCVLCVIKATMPSDVEAICPRTGKNEEVTGALMLSLIIETWKFLQQFSPPETFLPFDYNKNKRVSVTVGSENNPTAVCFSHRCASMSHMMEACSVHQFLLIGSIFFLLEGQLSP